MLAIWFFKQIYFPGDRETNLWVQALKYFTGPGISLEA